MSVPKEPSCTARDLDKAALELLCAARDLRKACRYNKAQDELARRARRARRRHTAVKPLRDRLEEAAKSLMCCLGVPSGGFSENQAATKEGLKEDHLIGACLTLAISLRSGVWQFAYPRDDPGKPRQDGEPLAPNEDVTAAQRELRAWGYMGHHLEDLALHVVTGHAVPGVGALTGMLAEGIVKSRQDAVDSLVATVRRGFGFGDLDCGGTDVGPPKRTPPLSPPQRFPPDLQ